jgi:hypothetical protein
MQLQVYCIQCRLWVVLWQGERERESLLPSVISRCLNLT